MAVGRLLLAKRVTLPRISNIHVMGVMSIRWLKFKQSIAGCRLPTYRIVRSAIQPAANIERAFYPSALKLKRLTQKSGRFSLGCGLIYNVCKMLLNCTMFWALPSLRMARAALVK